MVLQFEFGYETVILKIYFSYKNMNFYFMFTKTVKTNVYNERTI